MCMYAIYLCVINCKFSEEKSALHEVVLYLFLKKLERNKFLKPNGTDRKTTKLQVWFYLFCSYLH